MGLNDGQLAPHRIGCSVITEGGVSALPGSFPALTVACGARCDGYSNEKRWGVGSKVQGYSGPGRVTQKWYSPVRGTRRKLYSVASG